MCPLQIPEKEEHWAYSQTGRVFHRRPKPPAWARPPTGFRRWTSCDTGARFGRFPSLDVSAHRLLDTGAPFGFKVPGGPFGFKVPGGPFGFKVPGGHPACGRPVREPKSTREGPSQTKRAL